MVQRVYGGLLQTGGHGLHLSWHFVSEADSPDIPEQFRIRQAKRERLLAEGGTTILVSHRMVIFVLLAHLLGLDDDKAWRLAIAPGSLTAVEAWENGEIQLAFVNRT